jgi:chorismate mutase
MIVSNAVLRGLRVKGEQQKVCERRKRRLAERGRVMEIADWRSRIDGLDEQIVRLLNERAAAAVEIGKLKQKTGAPIYEPNREQTVFEHVRQVNPGPLTTVQIQDIYYRVMDVMRALQRVDTAGEGSAEAAQQQVGH